ncbi:cytochrome p450 [Moniliophthora roreri]|nr:cytochrome p450 [Moniliophthora roreri]
MISGIFIGCNNPFVHKFRRSHVPHRRFYTNVNGRDAITREILTFLGGDDWKKYRRIVLSDLDCQHDTGRGPKESTTSRLLGDWLRDVFIPFSGDILTVLVSKYKIEIPEDPPFAGETFAEKARVFRSTHGNHHTAHSKCFFL